MTSKIKSARKTESTAPKKLSKPVAVSPQFSALEVALSFAVKHEGLESVMGAAYLMMDKAFVSLSGDRAKTIKVVLRAKDPNAFNLQALAEEFLSDLTSQKIRWAVAKNNLPIREFIAEQAVLIANGTIPAPSESTAPAEPTAEVLTDDQRAEIEKLISEVEAEIKTMNEKKIVPDPKGIKASWEEKHEKENKAS